MTTPLEEAKAVYDEAAWRYIGSIAAGTPTEAMKRAARRAWSTYQHLLFKASKEGRDGPKEAA